MVAGLAVIDAVESLTDLTPKLKWPNDFMLPAGDGWLKFGGMLLEGQLTDGRWEASILGIGINVNVEPGHIPLTRWPATSLLKESGREIDRALLLGALLDKLESGYEQADRGLSPRQAWQSKLVTIGRKVTVVQAGNRPPLAGVAERTDEWGRLMVRDSHGREHAISAGDVSLQVDNS